MKMNEILNCLLATGTNSARSMVRKKASEPVLRKVDKGYRSAAAKELRQLHKRGTPCEPVPQMSPAELKAKRRETKERDALMLARRRVAGLESALPAAAAQRYRQAVAQRHAYQ